MPLAWFRFYQEALDDPKVQNLSGELCKHWVNLLCLTCRHDGVLPAIPHIAFALRISLKKAKEVIKELQCAGLITKDENGLRPNGWEKRQFKSDTSNERVKLHRNRQRNVTQAVTGNAQSPLAETPPDTDTDTDTDQNREVVADAPSRTAAKARLPNDWTPSKKDIEYACQHNLTSDDIGKEARGFVRYWTGPDAKNPRKADWHRTWCSRIDHVAPGIVANRVRNGVTNAQRQGPDGHIAIANKIIAEMEELGAARDSGDASNRGTENCIGFGASQVLAYGASGASESFNGITINHCKP